MNINNIEPILQEFLELWQSQEGYMGMLLTGSFASNTADEGSDIDLRIIYNNESQFHEFGDLTIAGKSVSFVGMSISFFENTFKEDLQSISKFEIRRFAVGKIIDDKHLLVQKLKNQAINLLHTSKIEGFDEGTLLYEKLMISRKFRVLLEMPETDLCFKMAYYDMLKTIFEFYAQHLQSDIPAFIKKWSRFLTNITYREANLYTTFPDSHFVSLITTCFREETLANIEVLYHYVITQSGGVATSNFFVRFHQDSGEVELFGLE